MNSWLSSFSLKKNSLEFVSCLVTSKKVGIQYKFYKLLMLIFVIINFKIYFVCNIKIIDLMVIY